MEEEELGVLESEIQILTWKTLTKLKYIEKQPITFSTHDAGKMSFLVITLTQTKRSYFFNVKSLSFFNLNSREQHPRLILTELSTMPIYK